MNGRVPIGITDTAVRNYRETVSEDDFGRGRTDEQIRSILFHSISKHPSWRDDLEYLTDNSFNSCRRVEADLRYYGMNFGRYILVLTKAKGKRGGRKVCCTNLLDY